MKKKQLTKKVIRRKYDLKKKGLTLAVTALMLSGSPLGVVSAFATDEEEGEKAGHLESGSARMESYYGNLVERLFVSPTSNTIAAGVDYIKVKDVQEILWDLNQINHPNLGQWLARTSVAVDGVVSAAIQSSRNLFTSSSWTTLKPDVTQATIEEALRLNNQLPDKVNGSTTQLDTRVGKSLANTAQKLLLRTQIEGLFTDNSRTKLVAGVDRAKVQALRKIVVDSTSMSAAEKAEFSGLLTEASLLLPRDAISYYDLVESLFVSPDSMEIQESINFEKIRQVEGEIAWLTYPDAPKWGIRLLQSVDSLANREIASVNALFEDANKTSLKLTTTQVQIEKATKKINDLPDQLQGDASSYDIALVKALAVKAQTLYVERVSAQIDGLFTDNTQTALADGVDQGMIDDLSVVVAELPDGEAKTELLNRIEVAQELLVKNPQLEAAQSAVESLFTDGSYTVLADGVTQVTIDEVKELVDLLPETDAKTTLLTLIEKAQEILTEASNLEKAQTAVNQLFTDETHGVLAKGVTQEVINIAKALVNQLSENQQKVELSTLIKVAQDLLDKQLEKVEITEFDTYTEGDSTFVSGKFTGKNVKYMRPVVNGENKLLITSVTLENGTFSYYLPGLLSTDKVEFVLFDSNYKEVTRKEMTIQESAVQITDFDVYEEGISSFIKGNFSGGEVKYMRPVVNGENKLLITSATLANGTFSYYLPGLKVTDKVEFVLFDANYKQVARKVVPITVSSTQITKFEAYEAGTSSFIKGEFSGTNVKYMRPVVNDENQALITSASLANGIFSYYLPGLKVTDKVEFVLFDANYREVARRSVVITASPNAVEISEFDAYVEGASAFIKGSYSGTNARYMRPVVNGENKALVGSAILADGIFSYYLPGLKATDKVEFVLFDANYKEVARKLLVIRK